MRVGSHCKMSAYVLRYFYRRLRLSISVCFSLVCADRKGTYTVWKGGSKCLLLLLQMTIQVLVNKTSEICHFFFSVPEVRGWTREWTKVHWECVCFKGYRGNLGFALSRVWRLSHAFVDLFIIKNEKVKVRRFMMSEASVRWHQSPETSWQEYMTEKANYMVVLE